MKAAKVAEHITCRICKRAKNGTVNCYQWGRAADLWPKYPKSAQPTIIDACLMLEFRKVGGFVQISPPGEFPEVRLQRGRDIQKAVARR